MCVCMYNIYDFIISAFEQGNLDLWRYVNAFIIFIIIIIIVYVYVYIHVYIYACMCIVVRLYIRIYLFILVNVFFQDVYYHIHICSVL